MLILVSMNEHDGLWGHAMSDLPKLANWVNNSDKNACPPVEEREAIAWMICLSNAEAYERRYLRRTPKRFRRPEEDWSDVFRFPVRKGEPAEVCQFYLKEWRKVMSRRRSMSLG